MFEAASLGIFLDFAAVLGLMYSPAVVESKAENEIAAIIEETEEPEFVGKEFFALYLYYVVDLPHEYGILIHESATSRGIDPWDLAAVTISEKSGPDYDFSMEGGYKQYGNFHWDNDSVGSEGEIGIFQIKPWWAKKAGYNGDDLFDVAVNIDVAGFVVESNMESHKKCPKSSLHDWIAHYKCGREDRNKIEGFCRFKQDNWLRIRKSLGLVMSPDFVKIDGDMSKGIKKKLKKLYKDSNKHQYGEEDE